MNKTVKSILCGVGACAGLLVLVVAVRCLIKGATIGDELKDWLNWVVAAIGGASTGYSVWKKENGKKD